MKFIYRNNEIGFDKWKHTYIREAERIVEMFPHLGRFSGSYYQERQKEYEDAVKILSEYESLLLWLDEEETFIFKRSMEGSVVVVNFNSNKVSLIHKNIFNKWQDICFINKKLRINKIDDKALGTELRRIRELNFLTVTAVANALEITPSTLRNYELANRTISLNVLYGLSQIYHVSFEKLIR